jgi:hypothetical protein
MVFSSNSQEEGRASPHREGAWMLPSLWGKNIHTPTFRPAMDGRPFALQYSPNYQSILLPPMYDLSIWQQPQIRSKEQFLARDGRAMFKFLLYSLETFVLKNTLQDVFSDSNGWY